jgi:hypothetical protein
MLRANGEKVRIGFGLKDSVIAKDDRRRSHRELRLPSDLPDEASRSRRSTRSIPRIRRVNEL